MQSPYILADRRRRRHPIRQAVARAEVMTAKHREDSDLKLFVLSFTAFFVCFYTFIA